MKKNFMAIASLLIAAMLLVVSCAPEANVEGKVEDGLVEAVIGLGRSAKDITIGTVNNAKASITYKYSLQPAWSSDNTGAPIYGAVSDLEDEMGVITGTHEIDDEVSNVVLGKVTPGLWKIHVIGYNGGEKVLEGKTSYYFNGPGTKATVFVAPVSTDKTVSVTIELKMQDLENSTTTKYDKIGYAFTDFGGTNLIVSPTSNYVMTATPSTGNVNTYTADVTVKSGFNTVTFSLPGYGDGKGGITKTFLAIPGVPVKITGSVTPAEFVEGNAKIEVLSINGGEVKVTPATGSAAVIPGEIIKEADEATGTPAVRVQELANGDTYTFSYDSSTADKDISDTVGLEANDITRKYQWYVAGEKIQGAINSSYDFRKTVAGDYNVTCVATVSFTKDDQTYNLQTSATMDYVRVLEATTQNGSNSGTGESGSTSGAGEGESNT